VSSSSSSYGYTDVQDPTDPATQTAADQYESSGAVSSSSSAGGPPLGKYYRVLVPDYTVAGSSSSSLTSYLRLGAVDPDSDAGQDLAEAVGRQHEHLRELLTREPDAPACARDRDRSREDPVREQPGVR